MLIRGLHRAVVGIAAGSLICVGHELQAQWGNNAPPCTGTCVPSSGTWGHYETRWRPWPGATYGDMMQRPASASEGAGVPAVELPPPSNEAEIQVPSPSRQRMSPPTTGGGNNPNLAPIPADREFGPTPRRGDVTPRVMPDAGPGVNELPGSLPPADAPPTPMGSTKLRRESNPIGHVATPRLKLRYSDAEGFARYEPSGIHQSRIVAEHREESRPVFQTAEQRRPGLTPARPVAAAVEPDLLQPSMANSTPNQFPAEGAESRAASGNPLRSGGVRAATFEEEISTTVNEGGPSPASGAVRANPLRR
ncbi:MAG: hypothetical protein IT427_20365 [Pirellulales bacterium]|nr:hypothetical protein [Pirellulales bacterium]